MKIFKQMSQNWIGPKADGTPRRPNNFLFTRLLCATFKGLDVMLVSVIAATNTPKLVH